MTQNSKIRRLDILSLNLKELKQLSLQTKSILSKTTKGTQLSNQTLIEPWMLSLSNQVFISRNKIGSKLLGNFKTKFSLDDPYILNTRFFVDYHRMHDPALRRYYNSIPVKNRLKKLKLISTENDAICTHKEFVEYQQYLKNKLNSDRLAEDKLKKEKRLSDHFQKLNDYQKYESQFTGIFRREKFKHERNSNACLIEEKRKKQLKLLEMENKAIQRAKQIKEIKMRQFKDKNYDEKLSFDSKRKMLLHYEHLRKVSMKEALDAKLKNAKERKEIRLSEKKDMKMRKGIEYFKKHSLFRHRALLKNIKKFELYEQQQRKKIEDRKKYFEQMQEHHENTMVKVRKEIVKKEHVLDIIDKILRNTKILSAKYIKSVDSADLEEISRRFSVFSRSFVTDRVNIMNEIFRKLQIPISSAILVAKTVRVMETQAIIIPEIGISKCIIVRERIADLIFKTINKIIAERLVVLRATEISNNFEDKVAEIENGSVDSKKRQVTVGETAKIIGESSCDEESLDIILNRKPSSISYQETHYNLNNEIRRELNRMFTVISKDDFDISEKLKTRDFVHLYEFQKYFLHNSMRHLIELVKLKQHHYWSEKWKIPVWRTLNLNLNEISFEAADIVMNYLTQPAQFCKCVCRLSKFICIEVSLKLEMKSNDDTSALIERCSLLSETE